MYKNVSAYDAVYRQISAYEPSHLINGNESPRGDTENLETQQHTRAMKDTTDDSCI